METPTEVEGGRKRQNEIIQPLLTGKKSYYREKSKNIFLNQLQ